MQLNFAIGNNKQTFFHCDILSSAYASMFPFLTLLFIKQTKSVFKGISVGMIMKRMSKVLLCFMFIVVSVAVIRSDRSSLHYGALLYMIIPLFQMFAH